MTVYILGGGPAGMALAHGLYLEGSTDFVLLERDNVLGGLARTVSWNDHGHHDLGPHKLFTTNDSLMQRILGLLPADQWLTRKKLSKIYMYGHFLPYPPSPFSLAKVFGPIVFCKMTVNYLVARIVSVFSRRRPETFEDDLKNRLGRTLYGALFQPIALKLWGDPKRLDSKLSQGRVQTPKLWEVIAQVLGLRRESSFEALTFLYPQGGLQTLWNSIERLTEHHGRFLTGREIRRLEVQDSRVTAIVSRVANGTEEQTIEVGPEDVVVSTLPLGLLSRMLAGCLSDRVAKLVPKTVTLNDLLLVFLKIDQERLLEESWVFVPDPNIAFHRISEQESFDPSMTPNGSIVCCEIMSSEERPIGRHSDAELVQEVLNGLDAMGYDGFDVLDQRVIRLPRSYPVFRPGFQVALKEILSELDALRNFRTVGRQGAFNYIGTLDAMDIGYGTVTWLSAPESVSWVEERERTSHFPVLD